MPVVLVVGTLKGAFLFTADPTRESWEPAGPLFKGWKVTAAGRTPDGQFLLATASDVYGPAIHKSPDLKEWRQIEHGPSYTNGGGAESCAESDRSLNQIWRFHEAAGVLYAGVDQAGLFRSEDAGESWQPVSGLNDHVTRNNWVPGAGGLCAHAILVDPTNPDRIWCGISAVGVFRSDDGGETWQGKNQGVPVILEDKEFKEIGFCVHALVQDPDQPDTIYRQDHTGMFRTRNGAEEWERVESGLPSGFGFPLAMDPRTKRLFAFPLESDEYRMPIAGAFRVFASDDGGDSWQPKTQGLPANPCYGGVLRGALAVDGEDPCGVYVGNTSGSVFASRDCGETWTPLPAQLPRVLSTTVFSSPCPG